MAPTPPPSSQIEWAKLGLQVTDSGNGHIQSTFSTHTQQWTAPTAVSDPWLRVHGLSPALNYGMQAFEGLKASRRPDGTISVFRPSFHAHRLAKSADAVSMPPVPEDVFIACVDAVIRLNAEFVGPHDTEAILYIRPLLIADGPQLAIEPPSTFTFAVYVQPGISLHGIRPLNCLVMEEFDRAAPRGTGAVKVGGNYAPVIKWGHAARAQGCPMTLHLDSRTQSEIDEFSTSGFIGVKKSSCCNKTVLVVPDSTNVIASVTSDSCLRVARDICGWTVEKRRIPYSELSAFDEVLAVGTAASVLPIKSIARNSTGDKFVYHQDGADPGPVGVRLAAELRKIMRGIEEDPFDWLRTVEFPDPAQAEEEKTPDVAGKANIGLLTSMSDLNGSARKDEVPESPMTFPDPAQAEEKKAPDAAGKANIGLLTSMSDLNGSARKDEVPESPMTFPDPAQAEEKKAPDAAGKAKIGLLTSMSDLNGSAGKDGVPESPMKSPFIESLAVSAIEKVQSPIQNGI